MTGIPVVIGMLSTITKDLVQELEDLEIRGRVESIQTTALLDRSEYWEESWRLDEICYHSDYSEKPSANAGVKNFQKKKKSRPEDRSSSS